MLRRWKTFDFWEWLYQTRHRLGLTGLVSLAALAAIGATVFILDARAGNRQAEALADYVERAGADPVPLLAEAGRANRLLLLADVAGMPEPKRLAADLLVAMARGPGVDALVLEVPSDEQAHIDRYLNTVPEDASVLLARPRAVREDQGREFFELYRTVWRLNRRLGPGRSIRVVAADLPDWPPRRALAPREAAALYAQRDAHMAEVIESEVLGPFPRARVLALVGGYHTLRDGGAELNVGGSDLIEVRWLGARLASDYPTEVYTALVEGTARRSGYELVAAYDNTRAFDIVRKGVSGDRATPLAVRLDAHFAFLREPIYENSGPGLELKLVPRDYRLPDVADAYVYFGAK